MAWQFLRAKLASLTARELSAGLVTVLMLWMAGRYGWLVFSHHPSVKPVLATWILFLAASGLALWTYFQEPKRDRNPITNIANAVDVVGTMIILGSILLFGEGIRLSFTNFEWFCLVGSAGIFAWYLWRRNARTANIAFNVMLVLGYLPLIVHLWAAKANTEPFEVWVVIWIAAVAALYNPLKERDFLAALYAGRAVVLVSIVLALMLRLTL